MSEQTQSNNQTVVIALVVIAVLLAAIVGVLIYQQSQSAKLATVGAAPSASTDAGTAAQAPAGMNAGTTTAFDAKTATKVPAGMTPAQLVKAYNEDVIAGKYADAYKLLPLDTKTNYGDVTAYGTQLKGYGITSYKIGTPAENGDTVTIAAEQVTPQMPITYTWTFKKVGSQWYVASRVMGGTVQ